MTKLCPIYRVEYDIMEGRDDYSVCGFCRPEDRDAVLVMLREKEPPQLSDRPAHQRVGDPEGKYYPGYPKFFAGCPKPFLEAP